MTGLGNGEIMKFWRPASRDEKEISKREKLQSNSEYELFVFQQNDLANLFADKKLPYMKRLVETDRASDRNTFVSSSQQFHPERIVSLLLLGNLIVRREKAGAEFFD